MHHRIEICRLQANEVFVNVNDFYDNPDGDDQQQFFDSLFKITVPDSTQTKIKEEGIPFDLWDSYRKKYNYRFLFKPYDEKDKFTFQSHQYFNGEATILYKDDVDKNEYLTASIPSHVYFTFLKFNTEITFNDKEMLSVFDDLQNKHPGKPMDILVVPTFMYNDFKLSVKCEDEIVPLSKYKIENIWGG